MNKINLNAKASKDAKEDQFTPVMVTHSSSEDDTTIGGDDWEWVY
jgi:hypothetical protein